jgi:hypothetical protein
LIKQNDNKLQEITTRWRGYVIESDGWRGENANLVLARI